MNKSSCASSQRPLELENSSFVPFEVLTKAFRIGQLLFHIVLKTLTEALRIGGEKKIHTIYNTFTKTLTT
jgi:hypothetical protein